MNQSKILHVVHLTTDSAIGGTERMILATANGLSDENFRSTVVTLRGGGALEHFCAENGIAYRSVSMQSKKDLLAVVRLYKILKDLKPDILHTYLFHANTLGRVVGKLIGVPLIVSGQRNVDRWRKWYHNLIDRLTAGFCSMIISNSQAGKMFLQKEVGIPERKIEVVHNGVCLPEIQQSSRSDVFTILNVASLTEKKGQEYLVKAFSRLREDGISAKLVIVGDGPQRCHLENIVKTANISDVVEFAGFQNCVDEYLRTCDVFVLPSLWEGLPVALMEAMAYGKPCVATRVGGIPELITDGCDGILLPPNDSHELYKALVKLYNDDALRVALSQSAQEKIKTQFTLDKMIESIEHIYINLYKDFDHI